MNQLYATFTTVRRSVPFSLRLQLAAWYTIAFAALLLLTGAVFYQYLEHSLEASVDTDLQLRAQQLAGGLVLRNGTLTLRDVTAALPGFGTATQGLGASSADVNQGALVRLLDAHRTLLGETPAFRALRVPAASVTQPLQGSPWQGTVLSTSDQAGSYWLAARSFAPIQRLAETARKIKAGDVHQRVPVPPVRDEVQYLAVTLNEMLDSLDQSFSRQRRFVADASHELRTPVAVIRNKADVALLQPRNQDEYCKVLRDIHAETKRLSHLISDLLALARGDEGQARFEREAVRLDWLVESVTANAEGLAQEHGIQLSVQAPQPVTMIGDEARLIQVIMNLLDNAIRYTNFGGQVRVSLTAISSEARLAVHDTGIGIAPEHLPHIFERFYRADPARRRTGGSSSGLGLAIVEWIVRAHGGAVVVESEVGRGSCFTITLPLTLPAQSVGPLPPHARAGV